VPTNGLVGFWPFNGNANDESGNGNNGVVMAGTTPSSDRNGNTNTSYYFDGFDGLNKGISLPINLNGLEYSTSIWFQVTDTIKSGQNSAQTLFVIKPFGVFDLAFNHPYAPGLMMSCLGDSLDWRICAPGNPNSWSLSNKLSWHNLTVVKNPQEYKYYVDGNLLRTQAITSNYNVPISKIFVGAIQIATGEVFRGNLDDIAIYNRALTQQEITQLYNSNSCIANITNNDTTICKGASVTLNAAAVNSASVTDINGNTYPTVNIGSQTWMQKNLNVSKYKNGDIIPQVTNATQWEALTTGAWCWYNNDSLNYSKYGKLYNWYAVNDPRGLAMDGWHVPSDGEWNKLVKYLDVNADTSCTISPCIQSNIAGGSLKETGLLNWNSPNSGATNISNFTALPSGYRYAYGTFFNVGGGLNFWSSDCFGRYLGYDQGNIYRGFGQDQKSAGFSVRAIRNSSTYLWSTGATTPSITVSPLVTTTYYCTVSDGVNTCRDSVKITVGATAVPSAPASITGATDVCSYFTSPTVATSNAVTYTAATVSTASSYTWAVPAGVTLVSGQGTNSITVTFASTFVSGAIAVYAVNVCGTSTSARSLTVYKRVAATPGTIQKEFSPTSITAVTNVTGLVSETYRIKKVTYATSYNWYMNRGTNATITHLNPLGVNDTAVVVTFVGCFIRDTLSVKSVTPCSVSTAKTAILYANTLPASVAGIGTAGGDFSVCIGTTKTFNAIAGTPTTTQAPIASFRWTTPANAVIVSATSDSSSINVTFNTGFTGGSLTAKGVTACGVIGTTATTAILQYLPPTPLSISSSTNSYNACINSSVTYTAIVGAPSTSQAPASVFRWTKPNNITITSASTDSSSITIRFNTGFTGGSLSVKGQTRCGTLCAAKSQTLTHSGCPTGTKMSVPVTTTPTSFEVSLYPNPSAGEFKLKINSPSLKSKATVKVIDLQGRLFKSFECNANQVTAIGNELKPGVYMVEVRMGDELKTLRAVKF
jgi:uncharacterized protein (TIGR02145 family)